MFAPDPIKVNRWLRAVIRCSDGSTEEWQPIDPEEDRVVNTLYVRSFTPVTMKLRSLAAHV